MMLGNAAENCYGVRCGGSVAAAEGASCCGVGVSSALFAAGAGVWVESCCIGEAATLAL